MNMISTATKSMTHAARFSLFQGEPSNTDEVSRVIWEPVINLDQAKNKISEAERIIAEQEKRIQQLEGMALTDELTNLVNRRGLMLSLRHELAAAKRHKAASGALVMIDLDYFKSINDSYGHMVGDMYLQAASNLLINEVRGHDIVSRLGGDEFAILMPQISAKNSALRVARMEQIFNSRVMHWKDQPIPLRASFGYATYSGNDTPESLIMSADLKLYAHKARHMA